MSDRGREALRRLGAPARCRNCGSGLGRFENRRTCYTCLLEEAREKLGRMERRLAVTSTDRASSRSYREACASMVEDADAEGRRLMTGGGF